MSSYQQEIDDIQAWMDSHRFDGLIRLYSAGQVAAQRGTLQTDYTVARTAAEGFHDLLRALFGKGESITTFGPYSGGQAVAMKRAGIEGIYLGGWATSAKGSKHEDPGADLASYPLSQVPDEAAVLVRALLTADKNQRYVRSQMGAEELDATPEVDFRPFIIADADTGHGGDPHVRNLIRRFVEVGVPGYHIEDQRPGSKKCGHQGGKVLVPSDEQIKRCNAARFQLDIMGVPGLIVARTDAEAATLLEGRGDERDQPFILGATRIDVPSYKVGVLSVMKHLAAAGLDEIRGHRLYHISAEQYDAADAWLKRTGLLDELKAAVVAGIGTPEAILDQIQIRFIERWEAHAGLKTYADAVADVMEFRIDEGASFDMSVAEWRAFAARASLFAAKAQARKMGLQVIWDCDLARTPEGYYQVRGGLQYAIAKSLAVAPFCDLLWMETKTAALADAKVFADAIHAVYPDKMLAYNLSPSFNWDTTGMNDEEMKQFPIELGKMGYVFNFITYGGHQIDGLAGEEFSQALLETGMLALATLQRKFRLVESPYKTPQSLVGGPRADGALMASSGRTATTKAMGKGSTQHQHLVMTEVPTRLLEQWLDIWKKQNKVKGQLAVVLRPHKAGQELLELRVVNQAGEKVADVVFATIQDRRGRHIMSVRDMNTFDEGLRRKRLMTLVHLWLVHRYDVEEVHYVSPTDAARAQTEKMKAFGIYNSVATEIGQIIVADVNVEKVELLLSRDRVALKGLIQGS